MKKLTAEMQKLWRRDGQPGLREVARRTNRRLSHTTVGNVLNGENSPRWSSILLVAEALGANPNEVAHLEDLWDEEQEATERHRLPKVKTAAVARPGDSLIFTMRHRHRGDFDELARIEEDLRRLFPDNEVTLLDGIDVTVVRPEAA